MTTAPVSSPPPAGGGERRSRVANPEVLEFPTRRRFSAAYKLRIVQEADAALETKQVGAVLRREGLHSSHLVAWRKLRDQGALKALAQPRGRKPPDPQGAALAQLQRENAQLRRRLEVAELVLEVQKKLSLALGIALPETEPLP
jgi:transposase